MEQKAICAGIAAAKAQVDVAVQATPEHKAGGTRRQLPGLTKSLSNNGAGQCQPATTGSIPACC